MAEVGDIQPSGPVTPVGPRGQPERQKQKSQPSPEKAPDKPSGREEDPHQIDEFA